MLRRRSATIVSLVLAALLAVLLAALGLARGREAPELAASLELAEVLSDGAAGFERAYAPRVFDFPADHGPHPGFRTEWWYFTGNLRSEAGRAFGYQLTFFRTALAPPGAQRGSAWATTQVYMAHAALSDLDGRRFHAFERFARGALGLAGARGEPFRVWLEDWSAQSAGEEVFPIRLRAREGEIAIDLVVASEKPVVLQGQQGLSQKGSEPGNASYYYSYTRLATTGTIRVGGRRYRVAGTSWLDREWSSGSLGRNQVGWDWFALQLDDGRDLMVGQLRESGSSQPFRAGVLVDPDGEKRDLKGGEIRLEVRDHWQSANSGARYPSGWRLAIPEADLDLEIRPALQDQELLLTIRYWEGAVRVRGRSQGKAVEGVGYAELTGYAASVRQARRRLR